MSVTIYKNANIDNQGLTSFAVENGKFIKFGKEQNGDGFSGENICANDTKLLDSLKSA